MPTAHFSSLNDCEVIEVEFLTVSGESRRRKLLVDSGFTGESSIVLGDHEDELIWAMMDPTQASGALQGEQNRAWVTCRIPEIGFQATVIAIHTDLTPLSLPEEIRGMAGLSFLRHFTQWGPERSGGTWRFSLSLDKP